MTFTFGNFKTPLGNTGLSSLVHTYLFYLLYHFLFYVKLNYLIVCVYWARWRSVRIVLREDANTRHKIIYANLPKLSLIWRIPLVHRVLCESFSKQNLFIKKSFTCSYWTWKIEKSEIELCSVHIGISIPHSCVENFVHDVG